VTNTRPRIRTLLAATAVMSVAFALAACVPEPDPTGSSPSSPAPSVSASDSVEPTASAPADRPQAVEISLPASCDALYSSQMRATLEERLPPLNDPAVTLYSTQLVPALEILESGVPTLRCSWGAPGGAGLSTNVTVLTAEDLPRVQDMLAVNGFGCEDAVGGILCSAQTETLDLDSKLVTRGESHFLRGNGWVATSWVGELPAGYTEDVAATLWG